jgi:glycosyltransferase involved in cell wall biosynthesis
MLTNAGHDSIVCFGRGETTNDPNVYKVTSEIEGKLQALYSRISGYAYTGSYFSTNRLLKIIEKTRPDVVHLHCLNGHFVNNYRLLDYLKWNSIKTILTLHAELMHTAKCGHAYDCDQWKTGCGKCPQLKDGPKSWFFDRTATEWRLKAEAFSNFNNLTIVPVSQWLLDRATQSPFFRDKNFVVIGNGIDTNNVFRPNTLLNLKQKHSILNKKVILHVTASFINPIKGGKYVLGLAERFKNENIVIVIVGYNGDGTNLPDNIITVKHTENQSELANYYSIANLTLLTSKRETYSMICAESLSCGTPVVGFKAGAPEQIALPEYSEFVEYGDMDALESSIRAWLNKKNFQKEQIADVAGAYYSKEKMYRKYFELYSRP